MIQARTTGAPGRIVLALLACVLAGQAFPSEPEPPRSVTTERATVRLMLLDVLVVDGKGATVSDLTADDFEILAGGELVEVDTLDLDCPTGPTAEPETVSRASKREALAPPDGAGPADPRRIVLALDYLHLGPTERELVFDQAREMVINGAAAGDEVMVVALTGGLRIEQGFRADSEETLRTLKRMRYDVSLWNGNFTHLSERGFVGAMTTLFDVLGTVAEPKAVVFYSSMTDVPLDLEFRRLAAVAAASRCSLYPVDLRGLGTAVPGLAGPTGGEKPVPGLIPGNAVGGATPG
jgi:VWFA-related protein